MLGSDQAEEAAGLVTVRLRVSGPVTTILTSIEQERMVA
jgi:hypothetical protein